MIVVADIGNTSIHFGIYSQKKLLRSFKLRNKEIKTKNLFIKNLKKQMGKKERKKVHSIITASVNKQIEPILFQSSYSVFPNLNTYKNLQFKHIKKYISFKYPEPETVGMDRWINYLSAKEKYNESFIILDAGTATTLCMVNPKAEFCGGLIAAGADMLLRGIHDYTDSLPALSFKKENSYLGKNTKQSISQAGYFGYLHLCKGLIAGLRSKFRKDYNLEPKIIFTGGNGKLLYTKLKLKNTVYEPFLTLDGLWSYYNLTSRY